MKLIDQKPLKLNLKREQMQTTVALTFQTTK
jgi:hypothetical protein